MTAYANAERRRARRVRSGRAARRARHPRRALRTHGTMDAMTGSARIAVAAVVIAALSGCAVPTPAAGPDAEPDRDPTPAPGGPASRPPTAASIPLLPATHPHVQLTVPAHLGRALRPGGDPAGRRRRRLHLHRRAVDRRPRRHAAAGPVRRPRRRRTTSPRLLDAYAVPDAPPTDDNCIMSLQDPLIVWLHVGEQITPVYAPRDGCGFPSDAADGRVPRRRPAPAARRPREGDP